MEAQDVREQTIGCNDGPVPEILVVDDDPINLMVIEEMLNSFGFQVATATDGVEAIEEAVRLKLRLILMDISMPRVNGIDAAIAIRKQVDGRYPKIVAVTANVTERQREACKIAGFDGFIAKPVEMSELRSAVDAMM